MMRYRNKNLIAWLSSVLVKLQVEVSPWQQGLCYRPVNYTACPQAVGTCCSRSVCTEETCWTSWRWHLQTCLYNAEMSWYKAKGVKTFVWTWWFLEPFRTDFLQTSSSGFDEAAKRGEDLVTEIWFWVSCQTREVLSYLWSTIYLQMGLISSANICLWSGYWIGAPISSSV